MISKQILSSIPKAIRIIRALSKKSAEPQLPLHQLRILFLVGEGMGQTQIAETLGVSTPAVSKIVNQLAEKDFIERAGCEDRRCVKLSLTSGGSRIMKSVSKKLENHFESALKTLTSNEKNDLERGLKILDKLMIKVSEV